MASEVSAQTPQRFFLIRLEKSIFISSALWSHMVTRINKMTKDNKTREETTVKLERQASGTETVRPEKAEI